MTKKIPKRERLYGEKYGDRKSSGMRRGHRVTKSTQNPNFDYLKLGDPVPTYHTSRGGVRYVKYKPIYQKVVTTKI